MSLKEANAIRDGRMPEDQRFAALSTLAKTLIEKRGHLSEEELGAFLGAGFTTKQILEVIAIVAASTITNYAGTVANPPLEDVFQTCSSSSLARIRTEDRGSGNALVWAPLASSRLVERESKMATQSASGVSRLGELLRYWRQEPSRRQHDLSLDAGISQRHFSFVKSGAALPARSSSRLFGRVSSSPSKAPCIIAR